MDKIVVCIKGGVCTAVLSDSPDTEVTVWDWDDKEEEGDNSAAMEAEFNALTDGMVDVF